MVDTVQYSYTHVLHLHTTHRGSLKGRVRGSHSHTSSQRAGLKRNTTVRASRRRQTIITHEYTERVYKSDHSNFSKNCARNPGHYKSTINFVFCWISDFTKPKTPRRHVVNKTGTSPHGISGVAVVVEQKTACLFHAQFYSFKDSTKENKQSS